MNRCNSYQGNHQVYSDHTVNQHSESTSAAIGEDSVVQNDNGLSLIRKLVWEYCQVRCAVVDLPVKILLERAVGLAKLDLTTNPIDPKGLKLLIALDRGVREDQIISSEMIDIFEFLNEEQLIAAAGLAESREVERKLYQKAGKLGSALANLHLSIDFELTDPKRSFLHCLLASQKNNVEALNRLGSYYERGFGTLPDLQKGIEAYEKGVELGGDPRNFIRFLERNQENPRAAFQLFLIYKDGKYGLTVNWEKALKSYDVIVDDPKFACLIPNFTKYDQEATIMMQQFQTLLFMHEKYHKINETIHNCILEHLSFLQELKASDLHKKQLEETFQTFQSQFTKMVQDSQIRNEIEGVYQQKLSDFDAEIHSLCVEYENLIVKMTKQLAETKKYTENVSELNDQLKNHTGIETFNNLIAGCEAVSKGLISLEQYKEMFRKFEEGNIFQLKKKGQIIMGELHAEKMEIIARHQKNQEIKEQKELAYDEIARKYEQLFGEANLYQERIKGSINNFNREWDALEVDPEEENWTVQIENYKDKILKNLDGLSIESRLKNSNQLSLQLEMRALESEKKLAEVLSHIGQTESKQHRKDQDEIDSLRKQLHEAQRRAEQIESKLNQQLEQQKSAHAQNVDKLNQKIDQIRGENHELRTMVQAIPVTTCIEILVKRIDRRIDELTEQGIKEVKQFKLKKLPKTLSGAVIKEILESLNYEEVKGKGSHRHYVGEDETMGLSVHNLGDVPDHAQVQQALNFLLDELLNVGQ